MVSVVCGLVVILFSVRNVTVGFIIVSCSDMPRQVNLLSRPDAFICRACFSHNCVVEEKLQLKRSKNVLEEVEKFCYLGNMIGCHDGASEVVSARIGNAWKKFRELSSVLVGNQGLSLKQGKIYYCCVRPVLLYCCWDLLLQMRQSSTGWSTVLSRSYME